MTRTILALLATSLVLPGCFDRGLTNWQKTQVEDRTTGDIEAQLAEFDSFAGGLAAVDEARGTWEECTTGYGGCERCYLLEGTAASGTIAMDLLPTEEYPTCTQALTVNDVRYEYTIDLRQWDGSWELLSGTPGEDALWSVEWTGDHDATLVIEGSENADGAYDSSFTMNLATGVTDGDGGLSEWTVDYSYSGFLDRNWTVSASLGADGTIAGTVISDDGVTCLVSGSRYDVVVDCE